MTTTRRFHTMLALVASLCVAAPGAASAQPKNPAGQKTIKVQGGYSGDGSGNAGMCAQIGQELQEMRTKLQASHDLIEIKILAANIVDIENRGFAAGCFFVGTPYG